MDWEAAKELAQILTPVALAIMAFLTLRQNGKVAAAKVAADAATDAAEAGRVEAAAAKEAAKKAVVIADANTERLDGRLTRLIEKFEDELQAEKDKNADTYTAGLAAGRAKALEGPIATSIETATTKIAEVQEHLTQQDATSTERHEATNGTTRSPEARTRADDKPTSVAEATAETVDAAKHANVLATKKKK